MDAPDIKPIGISELGQQFVHALKVIDEALIDTCYLPPQLLVVPTLGIEDIPPLIFMYVQAGGQLGDVERALALWVREGRSC